MAIVNSAVTNVGVHVSFRIEVFIFSGYMPRSGIAGSYGSSILVKELPCCSPQWLHQFTFPPTVQEGPLFTTPSPVFITCRFFDDDHSDWCEVIPQRSFDLHSSNN